jgi:hypothetical protein
MPNIFPSFDLTEELEQEIVGFLAHTGALACTCKAASSACRAVANLGDVCCPAQQFHHPGSAVLQQRDDDDDEEMPFVGRNILCVDEKNDDSTE